MKLASLVAPLLLTGLTMACAGSGGGAGQSAGSVAGVNSRSIETVLTAHRDSLMAIPGVVGTAIGLCDGVRCIKVMLGDSTPDIARKIPTRLEGYRVVTEVTGTLRPRG